MLWVSARNKLAYEEGFGVNGKILLRVGLSLISTARLEGESARVEELSEMSMVLWWAFSVLYGFGTNNIAEFSALKDGIYYAELRTCL